MNPIIAEQQRSLAWYRARLGKITGSRVGEIFSAGRAKDDAFSKTAKAYLTSVAAERLIPACIVEDDESFSAYLDETAVTSKAMRIGTEREAEARDLYADLTGQRVKETGCIPHPWMPSDFASSPDGLVMGNHSKVKGCLEIKCPKPATFMEYLSGVKTAEDLKRVNPLYYWQCMAHMDVTRAGWCDFAVYCPYISRPMHIVRIWRDEHEILRLQARLRLALDYVRTLAENFK